jgi:DNA-binding response OmpR family regulator
LIVEDEYIPAHYIRKILIEAGHHVIGIAHSKQAALTAVESASQKVDLILMDIKIKGSADGIETATFFQQRYGCAILFVSAYSDTHILERAKAIESIGYLVKPIHSDTLITTIEVGMSNQKQHEPAYSFHVCDDTIFDAQNQIIRHQEDEVHLSYHETRILNLFLQNINSVLHHEEIESLFYDEAPLGGGALRTLVWRLRKKIPSCLEIESVYKVGYKLSQA